MIRSRGTIAAAKRRQRPRQQIQPHRDTLVVADQQRDRKRRERQRRRRTPPKRHGQRAMPGRLVRVIVGRRRQRMNPAHREREQIILQRHRRRIGAQAVSHHERQQKEAQPVGERIERRPLLESHRRHRIRPRHEHQPHVAAMLKPFRVKSAPAQHQRHHRQARPPHQRSIRFRDDRAPNRFRRRSLRRSDS